MKFTWERHDIKPGLRVTRPGSNQIICQQSGNYETFYLVTPTTGWMSQAYTKDELVSHLNSVGILPEDIAKVL